MSETLISALIQVPFVLVIAYLMLRLMNQIEEREQEWRQFIAQRDAEWQDFAQALHEMMAERLERQTETISQLALRISSHNLVAHSGLEEKGR